jgi:RNA polymerase sigma factor for flagellar operon FliA
MAQSTGVLKAAMETPVRLPRGLTKSQRNRELAFRKYAHLVKYVVDKIAAGLPKSVETEDLTNAAVIGLFDAMEKYDKSKGTKFETYAVWRIRGAVLDELRALDWASRTTRRKAKQVDRVCQQLDQKYGRAASENEIAREMKISTRDLSQLMGEVRRVSLLSLNQTISSEDDRELAGLAEVIEDVKSADPSQDVETEEAKDILLDSVNRLPEQERLVIALYYYEEMTLKEIGETLHISESRVSQIHTKAIGKLKARVQRALYGE